MKKIVALASVLALTVSLAACQVKDDASKSAAPAAKVVKTEKVVKKEEVKKEVSLESVSADVRNLRVRVKKLEDAARSHGLVQ